MNNLKFCSFSVWSPCFEYKLVKNRNHGFNLEYGGYVYRRKMVYRNSINWVCTRQSNRGAGVDSGGGMCPGRCVTNVNGQIKLGKRGHDHPPLNGKTHLNEFK